MVQFLSIIFFLDFLNFCWVFQKFPFFLCHSVLESTVNRILKTTQGAVKNKTLCHVDGKNVLSIRLMLRKNFSNC